MRELIWLIIGVLFAYVAFQLYRAASPRTRSSPEVPPVDPEVTVEAPPLGEDEVFVFESSAPATTSQEVAQEPFHLALEARHMRHEIERLRNEITAQKSTIAQLRDTLHVMQEEIERAPSGPGTSPEYSEALVCARRGLDVGAIAERCGISVAEAELVKALTQQGEGETGEPK